eukprot:TRINITY_DN1247_c0_g2_i1.p1 TRINITY_DN1247_c0_g2~~TRINITY_DN1247_c0_g2_i1.p1  ORF type:complete len:371 (+),score=64.16 TRINITY_DN1247_c0_g2_i1:46-1113(+)
MSIINDDMPLDSGVEPFDEETAEGDYVQMNEPPPEDTISPRVAESHVASAAVILMGSVLGVYIRHCMQEPSEYGYYSYLFPNFAGSAVAGYLKKTGGRIWYNSIITGMVVGMCGSLTTFSSWQKAAGGLIGPVHLDSFWHNLYLWGQIEMTGLAVGIGGYDIGWYLGSTWDERRPAKLRPVCPVREKRQLRIKVSFDAASIIASFLVTGLLTGLTIYHTSSLLIALCTGPPAAWLRWAFSHNLNPLCSTFPVGTFTANILASALLATVFVLQLNVVGRGTFCTFLSGFGDGFCGSLSTVSTFVAEIRSMSSPHRALVYAFTSMLVSQGIFLGIIGIYRYASDLSMYHEGSACSSP